MRLLRSHVPCQIRMPGCGASNQNFTIRTSLETVLPQCGIRSAALCIHDLRDGNQTDRVVLDHSFYHVCIFRMSIESITMLHILPFRLVYTTSSGRESITMLHIFPFRLVSDFKFFFFTMLTFENINCVHSFALQLYIYIYIYLYYSS